MAVEQSTKQIVQSILAFLSDEKILTQVSESDRDSLGVSRECIAEAFGVQVDDKATSSASLVDMFSKMQPTGASNKPVRQAMIRTFRADLLNKGFFHHSE